MLTISAISCKSYELCNATRLALEYINVIYNYGFMHNSYNNGGAVLKLMIIGLGTHPPIPCYAFRDCCNIRLVVYLLSTPHLVAYHRIIKPFVSSILWDKACFVTQCRDRGLRGSVLFTRFNMRRVYNLHTCTSANTVLNQIYVFWIDDNTKSSLINGTWICCS